MKIEFLIFFTLFLLLFGKETASQCYFKMSSNTYKSTNLHELWYLRDTLPNAIITEIDTIILNNNINENCLKVSLHYDTCKNENKIETKDIKGQNIKIRQMIEKRLRERVSKYRSDSLVIQYTFGIYKDFETKQDSCLYSMAECVAIADSITNSKYGQFNTIDKAYGVFFITYLQSFDNIHILGPVCVSVNCKTGKAWLQTRL